MEDQQRLNNLVNEINVYRQQAELIQQQIELIQASIAEVDALFSTSTLRTPEASCGVTVLKS